jgi:hypothetical protein
MRQWVTYISFFFFLCLQAQDTTYLLSAVKIKNVSNLRQNTIINQCNPNKSMGEILSQQLGAFIRNYGVGGLQNVSFKGMSGNHVPIILSGYNMQSAMNGTLDISLIHPLHFDIANMENNSNQNGGPITLGQGLELSSVNKESLEITQGVDTRLNSNTGIRFGFIKNKWSYNGSLVNVLYQNRENLKRYEVPFDTFFAPVQGLSHLHKLQITDAFYGLLQLQYFGQNQTRNLPATLYGTNLAQQSDRNNLVSLMWQKSWNVNHQTTIRQNYRFEQIGYRPTENQFFDTSSAKVWSTQISHLFLPIKNLQIRGGLHYENIHFEQSRQKVDLHINRTMGFINGVFNYKKWQFFADNAFQVQNSIHQWILRYGASVDLNKIHFQFLWNKTARMPTMNEWYWNQPGEALGNPDLKPEQGNRWNLNFSQKKSKLEWEVDLYSGMYQNLVVWLATPLLQPINIKQSQITGADAWLKLYHRMNDIVFSHTLRANFTQAIEPNHKWLNPLKESKSNSKPIIFTPNMTSGYIFTIAHKKIAAYSAVSYTGKRYVQRNFDQFLPAFTLLDIGFSAQFIKWTLGVEVSNILDEAYHALPFVITPGRAISLNATYPIKYKKND